ncbi:MAG TPA: proteasome subunit alpha [Actinobacteria bacterium]|nr:proteasome subunit alpha [Actinomycetota bacterium]
MTMPFYVPPEQLVKDRAEYAKKGIARGRSIVALETMDGVLLLAENPSRTLTKISEIYDRIAFAGVGRYNEFEALRVAGIRHADVKGYQYGRTDVMAKSLASAFSHTLGQIFIQGAKPYEIEILITEVGSTPSEDRLYKVTFDGTLYDEERFAAIGGQSEALTAKIGEGFNGRPDLAGGLQLAANAFREVEDRTIEGWEAAILDRGAERRSFRRLTEEELAATNEVPSG